MSNRQERIARKRQQRETGEHYFHEQKRPTPISQLKFLRGMVQRADGSMAPRRLRVRERFLAARGLQYGDRGKIIPKDA
ncbi:hypothetical protein SEA_VALENTINIPUFF_104 [Microbacterium phage ValentiniPuff]|uniref:Uncharacterized protein n=1 Tax=Microbacterium phage ValentiniPuff TaxID=2315705 RepID=A0A386KP78_9CAUD|nr:hypothetical protein SEA_VALENTINIPUFF_104 [Microbacterium phage ValentiniPuff]